MSCSPSLSLFPLNAVEDEPTFRYDSAAGALTVSTTRRESLVLPRQDGSMPSSPVPAVSANTAEETPSSDAEGDKSDAGEPRPSASTNERVIEIPETTQNKMSSVFANMSTFVSTEFSRIFSSTPEAASVAGSREGSAAPATEGDGASDAPSQPIVAAPLETPAGANAHFPPQLAELDAMYAAVDRPADAVAPHDSDEEVSMKEFMRTQGLLGSLTALVGAAPLALKVELIATIVQLLHMDGRSQAEFRDMAGYDQLARLFDTVTDFDSGPPDTELRIALAKVFDILFAAAIDGRAESVIGNPDAAAVLLTILRDSSQLAVKMAALLCVQDLIAVNALNAAAFDRLGALDVLFNQLEAVRTPSSCPVWRMRCC